MASLFQILAIAAAEQRTAIRAFYLFFAIVTIAGGVMGFVKAKSTVSLVSGSISGILLIVSCFLLPSRPMIGGVIALCVSVLLAGKFVPDFVHKKALVPGGLMALLSLASIVVTILALTR